MSTINSFPLSDREDLIGAYKGALLQDVPVPSAILDVALLRRNCELMLGAAKELNVAFRAHVKTHKTSELSRLQVGEDCKDVRLICSTIAELEHLEPLLAEFKSKGAQVNVLYGVPVGVSHYARLGGFLQRMGSGSLALMIDHPEQLSTLSKVYVASGKLPVKVYLKTDSGYHRAGLAPSSQRMQDLVNATLKLESKGELQLIGFYSHNSLSYGGNSPAEAMDNLRAEVEACTEAVRVNTPPDYVTSRSEPLYISSGASPTALSLQNLLAKTSNEPTVASANALRASLAKAREANIHFEIHAGVYPVLDMQQIAASSRNLGSRPEDNIAFTVMTEVCSTYPDRTENPEALVNAGGIALAREPCKSYRGHGVITPWNMPAGYNPFSMDSRIIIDRVSQEHGLLQWEDRNRKEELPVTYGQRLRLWPNHACITGSQYGWYLVIDSESDNPDVVKDVWVRWRGW